MTRTYASVTISCDAVVGTDPLGDVYCACRLNGRGWGIIEAQRDAKRRAEEAGWVLTAQAGRDLCRKHAVARSQDKEASP